MLTVMAELLNAREQFTAFWAVKVKTNVLSNVDNLIT